MSESRTRPIYLDNHATTPMDPRVLESMIPYFRDHFGNAASSTHPYGWEAAKAVEDSRKTLSDLINAQPKDIVFTSGGTEADNLALLGAYEAYKGNGNHVITTKVEHKAVLEACHELERRGAKVTYLDVDHDGYVHPDQLENAITDQTILVSLIFGNNEIGTIQDMKSLGKITKKHDVLLHTDAVQAFGKTPIDVVEMNIDMLSISGHKIYGPKGVGALFVRQTSPRIQVEPLTFGGGHERGMRSGTLNVPGIVGLAVASKIAVDDMKSDHSRIQKLRELMKETLTSEIDNVVFNGPKAGGLPNNLSVTIRGFLAGELLKGIPQVAFSTGSACSSSQPKPSYVLKNIGLSDDDANATIRFGLGRFTTQEEVEIALQHVVKWVKENQKRRRI
ncbi:MAG: cysteine desulfurase [Bdellovibrionales bacterium]|nr:cysteine desulfurase [Bdellovibrionales bacterium]